MKNISEPVNGGASHRFIGWLVRQQKISEPEKYPCVFSLESHKAHDSHSGYFENQLSNEILTGVFNED